MTATIDRPDNATSRVLDAKQVAHLRHFGNLSRQPKNDWSLMGSRAAGQDDFTSYRYQLAYMIYTAALTHRHRLPAAPGAVQPMIQRMLAKLQDPEVWMFWRDSSRGGAAFNAHLSHTYVEQWDPVAKDNIMFSAYVQSGALLHDYLFDSDHYAQPGSLSFDFWTMLWGGDPKHFEYDRNSLNDLVYWQMVKNGYLGVACEPNCVFQICNQPAILGFRLHDLITGGNRAEEVIANYEQAWADFGRLDAGGHYNMFLLEDSKTMVSSPDLAPWVDAWAGTVMNMWNRDFVRANYPRQVAEFLVHHDDGTISVRLTPSTVEGVPVDYSYCDFGWVSAWATEMGDVATRDGLLAYADAHLKPRRREGGLFYPRNDNTYDADGHYVEVDPLMGNVLLAFARLNIPDGFHKLFTEPWDRSHWEEPALTVVDDDVDVSRAEVLDGVLRARVQRCADAEPAGGRVVVGRVLGRGNWRVEVDGTQTELPVSQDGLVLALTDDDPHDLVVTPLR